MAENLVATEAVNTLNDERARRLADRAALYAAGKNPYPEHSSVTDHAADLLERYEGLANEEFAPEVVTIGGRVVAKRGQGKIMFIVVRDPSADIQLFCRVNDVEEESWEVLKELDLGDIVQATGQVTRTKRGELSVAPRTAQLLSKAVRPLPEKFHGLSDKETRYRQRYVDLIVNEGVRETFRKRSAIVSAFRRYMEDNGYMEVETPILQSIQGGATAKPFITHFNALNQENYLRIATELHLKRLLVGGYERVFEIGRIFRNEGMDLTHNPEFTTMEAYRAYSDLEGMKELAEGVIKAAARAIGLEGMIDYQGQAIDLFSPWPSRPMTDVVSEVLGREVTIDTPVEELRAACDEHDIEYKPEWTAGKLIAELFDELGEAILINPTSSWITRRGVPAWPSATRTTRVSRTASSCSSPRTSTPTRSPSSTTRSIRPSASPRRWRRRPEATMRPWSTTRITCAPSSTVCPRRAASASASTAWSCCLPTPRPSATSCCSRT